MGQTPRHWMAMAMRTLFRRLWHAIRHRRFEAELAEEIEFHRAMRARDLEKSGLASTEATRAAMRALGNVGVARDEVRDVWIPPWLQGLSQDLRFAVRLLVKDSTFTAAAVLTLALGIGLNASIFSAVYGILLKPLPFTDADRLVAIWKKNPPRGWTRNPVSAAELLRWRAHGQVLADIAAFRPMSCVVTGGSGPEEDPCETVSSNLFPMLGVTPIRGRAFVTEEDDPDDAARRDPRLRLVATALRRQPRRDRRDDHGQRPQSYHRRRDAGRRLPCVRHALRADSGGVGLGHRAGGRSHVERLHGNRKAETKGWSSADGSRDELGGRWTRAGVPGSRGVARRAHDAA